MVQPVIVIELSVQVVILLAVNNPVTIFHQLIIVVSTSQVQTVFLAAKSQRVGLSVRFE
jgi:hypothetical protein